MKAFGALMFSLLLAAPAAAQEVRAGDLTLSHLQLRAVPGGVPNTAAYLVIANAGTTNTGAIDPLDQLADLCERENLWLHVDGAYGAAACLSERGRRLLNGIERADSLSLDPHKWLFQPFEIGCVLARDARLLKKTFHTMAGYLEDTKRVEEEEINYYDYGVQLTRGFRALKLWLSIKTFGAAAFREAIRTARTSSHGVMLFDLSQLEEYGWWGLLEEEFATPRTAPHDVPDLLTSVRTLRRALSVGARNTLAQ